MRWLGSCGVVVVLVAACTRPNAGFEGGEASTADEQGEVGQEGEGTTTAGEGTTRGSADTTDASDTRATTSGEVETTANVTSEATLGSSSDSSESGTPSCPSPAEPYEIETKPPLIGLPFVECQGGSTIRDYTFTLGDQIDPTTVSAQLCSEMCNCKGPVFQLGFDAPLPPLPPASECFRLLVEFSPTDQNTCFVSAYLVQGEGVLLTMVSNRMIPEALGLPVEVTLGELAEECEGCGDPPSGSYALESLGVSIPPGGMGEAGGFAIHNAGAVVDEKCTQVVRWSAMQMPG